jgi:hypothetical protein
VPQREAFTAETEPVIFELACALAFVSGRSLAELMSLGNFSGGAGDNSIDLASSHPGVLFALQHSKLSSCYSIPLLCDTSTFLAGIHRLRQLKVVPSKECKDINKSHCKTANTAAKTLLGCSTAVFTDLRIAYVALTFKLYGNRVDDINEALERQMIAWLANCMPLAKLSTSPAFFAQCCATYLATPQVPDSCRREASVAAANRERGVAAPAHERDLAAAEPRKIMDTHSIVLKVLPLLVHMYHCQARQMSSAQGVSSKLNMVGGPFRKVKRQAGGVTLPCTKISLAHSSGNMESNKQRQGDSMLYSMQAERTA